MSNAIKVLPTLHEENTLWFGVIIALLIGVFIAANWASLRQQARVERILTRSRRAGQNPCPHELKN